MQLVFLIMSSNFKIRLPIQGQSRRILLNVHDFMKKEAEELKNCVFTPDRFTSVFTRTAEATKVPKPIVKQVLHRKAVRDLNRTGPWSYEIRHEGRRRTLERVYLNDYEYQYILHKIYDLHLVHNQPVTMTVLLNKLIETDFAGGKAHLRQLVKEMGFKFKKNDTDRIILIERHKARLLRIKYLKQIKTYRSEGRNIIYGNETNIHLSPDNELIPFMEFYKVMRNQYSKKITILFAGNENGFVPNALVMNVSAIGDEQNEMNKEKYEMWLQEHLIPNLQHNNTIFVVDYPTYSRTLEDSAPTSNATKNTMQLWLTSKNIQFDPTLFKPELYEIIKHHKRHHVKYSLDTIMESHGHKVLVLPPYTRSFSAMKFVSSLLEIYLARDYDVDMTTSELLNYIAENFATFEHIDATTWLDNAIKFENEYLTMEDLLDTQDQLTKKYYDDSSTSGSSYGDSTNESSAANSEAESEPVQPSTSRP